MRACLFGDGSAALFSNQLLSIGNGQISHDPQVQLHHMPCGQMVSTVNNLKALAFPNIVESFKNTKWLCERAILAPRNDADDKNLDLLQLLPGQSESFRSIHAVLNQKQVVQFSTEFLNSLQPAGMPHHNLILRKDAPFLLLWNLNLPRLCKGTKLVIKFLNPHVLEATTITGWGEDVFIPRIPLIPFEFKRLQFPIRLSFATSITKSQGQFLKVVGSTFKHPAFFMVRWMVPC